MKYYNIKAIDQSNNKESIYNICRNYIILIVKYAPIDKER